MLKGEVEEGWEEVRYHGKNGREGLEEEVRKDEKKYGIMGRMGG